DLNKSAERADPSLAGHREVTMRALLSLGAALLALAAGPASAAEITLLTAGAMRGGVDALIPKFAQQSGDTGMVDNATAGVLAKRIEAGEAFDAAIITAAVVDRLIAGGKLAAESRVALAKVGIGVVVREGAPPPDIATVAAFRQTLLAAKSVAYIDPKA